MEIQVDSKLWKETLRAAIATRYLPASCRHLTIFPASYAHGLVVCAEDLLKTAALFVNRPGRDGLDPTKRKITNMDVLALIGFCKAGPFSIEAEKEVGSKIPAPINSQVN